MMTKSIKNTLVACALTLSTITGAHAADLSGIPSGTYEVDPTHAYISFSYSHLGFSKPILSFDDFTIDLKLDTEDPAKSSVTVSIDPSSIVAGSDIWKEHITGPDFFDVANNPKISFVSSTVEAARDGTYTVIGDLVIKGQAKPVTLIVAVNAAMDHPMSGSPVLGFDATAQVLRSDWGLGKYVPNVGDEVTVTISAELKNKP